MTAWHHIYGVIDTIIYGGLVIDNSAAASSKFSHYCVLFFAIWILYLSSLMSAPCHLVIFPSVLIQWRYKTDLLRMWSAHPSDETATAMYAARRTRGRSLCNAGVTCRICANNTLTKPLADDMLADKTVAYDDRAANVRYIFRKFPE